MSNRVPLPVSLKAVFLDAGGVLVVPDVPGVLSMTAIDHEADVVLDAFYAANDELDQPQGSDAVRHRWLWQRCFTRLGYDAEASNFRPILDGILNDTYNPFFPVTPAPGVAEALSRVAAMTEKIVVVSNANGNIESGLREGGVCQVGPGSGLAIHAVIDSTIVGVDKPNPEIFKAALDVAGVSIDEVVHIGDSLYSDMEGARRSGIAGIHINRSGSCADQSHFHARDLSAAVDLLVGADAS